MITDLQRWVLQILWKSVDCIEAVNSFPCCIILSAGFDLNTQHRILADLAVFFFFNVGHLVNFIH